ATWVRSDTLAEAGAADRYLASLDAHPPAVFLLRYTPEFAQGVAAQERNIRIGLSPDRDGEAFFFVGEAADLLAERRTPAPNQWSDDVTLPYWEAVRGILPQAPPVLVLRSVAAEQFR